MARSGFAQLRPDLVSLQEVVKRDDYDQVRDVLGEGHHVVHHSARLADGQGDSIASRWPISAVHHIDVPEQGGTGVMSSALAVHVTVQPGKPGHTFTPDNTLTTTAEGGTWELEPGRRIDYILVRCISRGPTLQATACQRFLDEPFHGVWASAHFGVTADLSARTPTGRPAP